VVRSLSAVLQSSPAAVPLLLEATGVTDWIPGHAAVVALSQDTASSSSTASVGAVQAEHESVPNAKRRRLSFQERSADPHAGTHSAGYTHDSRMLRGAHCHLLTSMMVVLVFMFDVCVVTGHDGGAATEDPLTQLNAYMQSHVSQSLLNDSSISSGAASHVYAVCSVLEQTVAAGLKVVAYLRATAESTDTKQQQRHTVRLLEHTAALTCCTRVLLPGYEPTTGHTSMSVSVPVDAMQIDDEQDGQQRQGADSQEQATAAASNARVTNNTGANAEGSMPELLQCMLAGYRGAVQSAVKLSADATATAADGGGVQTDIRTRLWLWGMLIDCGAAWLQHCGSRYVVVGRSAKIPLSAWDKRC
jgi:hypothetical protein